MTRLGGISSNTQVDTSAEVDAKVALKGDKGNTIVGGSTYPVDGVADNVQLQAALDAVHAAGGGVVEYVKPLTIDTTITLYADVTLIGHGDETPIMPSATFNAGVALRENSGNANGLTLIDVTVDCANKAQVGGIHIYRGDYVKLIRPHLYNMVTSDPTSKWGIRVGHYVNGTGDDVSSKGLLIEDSIVKNCNCGTFEQMLIVNQQDYRIVRPYFESNTNSLAYELMLYINNKNGVVDSPHFKNSSANAFGVMESKNIILRNVTASFNGNYKLVTIINTESLLVDGISATNTQTSPTTPLIDFFDRELGPDGFTQIVDDTKNVTIQNVNVDGWRYVGNAALGGLSNGANYTQNISNVQWRNITASNSGVPFNIGVDSSYNNLNNWIFDNVVINSWSGTNVGAFQLRGYTSGPTQMYGFKFNRVKVPASTGVGSFAAIRAINMVVDSVENSDLSATYSGYGALSTVGSGSILKHFNNNGLSDTNATTTQPGLIQVAGDLGGTYAIPKVKSRSVTATVGPSGSNADYVCDGTADNVEIQAAIDAVNTAGGGTVLLRNGTYTVAASVVLKSGVTLMGEGMGRTVITGPASDVGLVKTTLSGTTKTVYSDIAVRDITFSSKYGTCLAIFNTDNVDVTGCEFTFTVTTPIRQALFIQHCQYVLVDNNFAHDYTGNGLSVTSTDYFVVSNNLVSGGANGDDGIDIDFDFLDTSAIPSNYGTVVGNTVRTIGRGNGIRVENSNYVSVAGNTVDSVTSTASIAAGIMINTSSTNVGKSITVSGNTVSNCVPGGIAVSGTNLTSVTVTGNVVVNSGQNGGSVRGGIILNAPAVNVTGNTIDGTAKTGTDGAAMLIYKTDGHLIASNIIRNSVTGLRAWNGDALQSYTSTVVTDNILSGNTTAAVTSAMTSASRLFNNYGLSDYGDMAKQSPSSVAITGGTITGITDLAIADGGTGASTATAALNNLLPTQTGNNGKVLQTDGTTATWQTVTGGGGGTVAFPTLLVASSEASADIKAGADYVCDGTDDHVQIQAAIDSIATTGGTVTLTYGQFTLGAAIAISASNINVEGQGVGTELFLANGANDNVLEITGTGTVEVKIKNLSINGNKANNTSGNGIYISTPWASTDTQHLFEDLYIKDVADSGVYIPPSSDTRVMWFNRVHIKNPNDYGFYFEAASSMTDSVFYTCVVDLAGIDGFYIGGLNNHFYGCKSFWNTRNGFRVTGYTNYFVSCEAQDNFEEGWYAEGNGAYGGVLTACVADANGQGWVPAHEVGVRLIDTNNWQINGGMFFNREWSSYAQLKGISLEGTTTGVVTSNIRGIGYTDNATQTYSDTSSGTNTHILVNGEPIEAGDVDGPASATDNALTRFNGATGKLVQNSGATLDDNATLTLTDPTAPTPDEQPTRAAVKLAHTNGTGTSTYRISQNSYDLLQIDRTGDTTGDGSDWSIIDLVAPNAAQNAADANAEATLSLSTRRYTPSGEQFSVDVYNNDYKADRSIGFREQVKNTAVRPLKFDYHDKTTSNGAYVFGEIYATAGNFSFIAVDSERTGGTPAVEDWVYDNTGTIFAADTHITSITPNTPSAGTTTYGISRAVLATANPGVGRGSSIREWARFTPDRQFLVRKMIASATSNVAEFGGNIQVDGKIVGLTDPTSAQEAATKAYVDTLRTPRVSTLTASSNTYTPNATTTDEAKIISPVTDFTIAAPSGTPADRQRLVLTIKSDATGRTPTWNAIYQSSGVATLPTTALPASKTVTLGFVYDTDATKWVLRAVDATGY